MNKTLWRGQMDLILSVGESVQCCMHAATGLALSSAAPGHSQKKSDRTSSNGCYHLAISNVLNLHFWSPPGPPFQCCCSRTDVNNEAWIQFPERTVYRLIYVAAFSEDAHAGIRTRVTSMGGLYGAAELRALAHCMRTPPQPLEF